MQDYGEVICVIGSSANYETMGVFMQADARSVLSLRFQLQATFIKL